MDAYEATEIVMSRIQSLDPENASRIMGYILIQDQGEKEMIRLAFGPETLLLSYINQAKAYLGLPSKPQRILVPNNGFHYSNPSSPASFPRTSPRPISYAAVLNGSSANSNDEFLSGGGGVVQHPSFVDCSAGDSIMSPGGRSGLFHRRSYNGSANDNDGFLSGGVVQHPLFVDCSAVDSVVSPSVPFHRRSYNGSANNNDEFLCSGMVQQRSFVDCSSVDSMMTLGGRSGPFHRRSCSVNDAVLLSNVEQGVGGGFGCRPCMYFAKGFCRNGSNCKFLHGDIDESSDVSSGFDEFIRMKALERERFAFMASGGRHSFSHNKFLNENQRRGPRNEFSAMEMAAAAMTSCSRQIYLTFPADSAFREDDVSRYFSMFGPVRDVRIPYQQKRMFGFVTFLYPETVKLVLAKGNPHYVCDSRVLVKPYKEKGKAPDKKHSERGEYSCCVSPSEIDSRELFDPPVGPRMLLNTQEMMLLRKLEQEEAELQHAIELQGRSMENLQLMDLKHQQHNYRFLPSLPASGTISPLSQLQMRNVVAPSDATNQDVLQEFGDDQERSPADNEKLVLEGGTESPTNNNILSGNKNQHLNDDVSHFPESLEHILPDNLFASPTKLALEHQSIFSHADNPLTIASFNNSSVLPSNSPFGMVSLCYSQTTRCYN